MEYVLLGFTIATVLYFLLRNVRPSTPQVAQYNDIVNDDFDIINFRVVGVSFPNDDGSKRQDIIKQWAKEDEPVYLKIYAYKKALACAVFLDEQLTKQIGNIAKEKVADIIELSTTSSIIEAKIHSIEKGSTSSKRLYGVTIDILVRS